MRKLPTPDMSGDTYYVVLGISETASQDQIKRAYRRLIRRVHPDKFPDAPPYWKLAVEQKSRKVIEAYYVLSNSTKRSFYDQQLAQYRQQHSAPTPHPRTAPTSGSSPTPPNPRPPTQARQRWSTLGFGAFLGGILIAAAILLTLLYIVLQLLFPLLPNDP
jgi:curved DNA-binding protein CbpA